MKTLLRYGWIAFAVGLCIGLTAVVAFAHGDAAWIMQYGYRDKGIHQSRDAQVWRCVPHGKMNCLFLSAGI